MKTVRLTMAQALVRYLCAQQTVHEEKTMPLFAGMWAIFGHGNVAGMGEALFQVRETLPTYRAHNEQAMAHAAIAYSKACQRRRMMACTTSIGPGATNMVTAAALAHVNRLPVLLLPGDIFANRRPDPVLQQIESFSDGTLSANDCFRPVSRYWDRITRPEQLLTAMPQAMSILTDPADCGPVTLGLCQDVQAEAYDYPAAFFEPRLWQQRRLRPDRDELAEAVRLLSGARRPLIIAGGGIHYSGATEKLARFAADHAIPVAETQAGKGALAGTHPHLLGAIGVTGSSAANRCAEEADVILAVGTRLQDFTTASRTLFPRARLIQLNVARFDTAKHDAVPLMADALEGLMALEDMLAGYRAPEVWQEVSGRRREEWHDAVRHAVAPRNRSLPSDAEVLGAVNAALPDATIVCAAGGLPGELHKLWNVGVPGSYHLEYGYSCMGYEIAGGLGVKMAHPERTIVVMLGDGSYLMMNSEIATSVMLDRKLIIVLLDNRGYGCIDRLQRSTGSESFNNLLADTSHETLPALDFAAHAKALGADSVYVRTLDGLSAALERAKAAPKTSVIVIDTDPTLSTQAGGAWWDVAVPEVSPSPSVVEASHLYQAKRKI
ncbi:MAG TPA: 3D-(3,5/4)-trihydroxycyclohexane-1,2-dione acylhydrolase (decyclizing) [Dongiaceae bacterium]|nr:3D-(3,5/4)-trihydroxycyclohexane-1,2-dione acylhydrolase (decyclizing) [Dongiaceae bacterium]